MTVFPLDDDAQWFTEPGASVPIPEHVPSLSNLASGPPIEALTPYDVMRRASELGWAHELAEAYVRAIRQMVTTRRLLGATLDEHIRHFNNAMDLKLQLALEGTDQKLFAAFAAWNPQEVLRACRRERAELAEALRAAARAVDRTSPPEDLLGK